MTKRAPARKPKDHSAVYRKILAYINAEPRLLSTLYDLNLLPELVEHDHMQRRAMLACYFGYRVGKDTPAEKEQA